MNITKVDITHVSRSENFNLIGLGDIHLGAAGCDTRKLKETVETIEKTPRTLVILMGDLIECINITDPRFDPYSIDRSYDIKSISRLIPTQIDDICSILEPIKHKIIAMLTGNHEESVRLKYNFDVSFEIARRLNVINLGYDGWVQLKFIRKSPHCSKKPQGSTYDIYATHGFGGARKSGAKVNRLEDVATYMDADIILMGHEHKRIVAPPILKLCLDRKAKLQCRKQIAVMTGSFLHGYVENATTYVEKKGYSPADLGIVKIILKPDIKDIHTIL